MSYRANVDIVIALNALKITSFRKQGRLRFRLSLLRTLTTTKKNVLNSQKAGHEKRAVLLHSLQYLYTVFGR